MKWATRVFLAVFLCCTTSSIEAFSHNVAQVQQKLNNYPFQRSRQLPNVFTSNQKVTNTRVVNSALFSSAVSVPAEAPVFTLPSSITAPPLGKLKATLTKFGMMAFIASMCLALPVALLPPYLLLKMKLINRVQKEQMALHAGQFCARWLLRLIPFAKVTTIPYHDPNPEPSIWVCNHVSALDIFMLLATDRKLRGKNTRPIKIVYVS